MNYKYAYLVRFQYLGFRLHGWQKQPNLKTVHFFVDKTLKFVCKGIRCKSVGVGRTDAKVSSTDYYFQLFIDEKLDESFFMEDFNRNSPSDIRVVAVEQIEDEAFNIIRGTRIAQMVLTAVEQLKWVHVTELTTTERGQGGFGSTGTK